MDLEFGLNFAYPVTLGVVLLAAHLVIFHKHDASPVVYEKSDVRTGFRIIWCLQAALCLILVSPYARSQDSDIKTTNPGT